MSLKFILLGCGSSMGVPRPDGSWGKCNPNELRNYRTRCSALISSNNLNILIDTSPDLRFQLIKQKYHPNFFLIENFNDKQIIDIKQVKNMISFANKTSYEKKIKFI